MPACHPPGNARAHSPPRRTKLRTNKPCGFLARLVKPVPAKRLVVRAHQRIQNAQVSAMVVIVVEPNHGKPFFLITSSQQNRKLLTQHTDPLASCKLDIGERNAMLFAAQTHIVKTITFVIFVNLPALRVLPVQTAMMVFHRIQSYDA